MSSVVLEQHEFHMIRDTFQKLTGIELCPEKSDLILSRLHRRLRKTQKSSIRDYLDYLIFQNDAVEIEYFIDVLTTHETSFFRELPHYEFLINEFKSYPQKYRFVNVLSAASSTGEEAYSIALTLKDLFPSALWTVIGTDVSLPAVQHAEQGKYWKESLDKIPKRYQRFVDQVELEHIQITDCVRNHVHFQKANLLDFQLGSKMFDVIFLRNVLIYFTEEKKKVILHGVSRYLRTGGFLIIGHTEAIVGARYLPDFDNLSKGIFRKGEGSE